MKSTSAPNAMGEQLQLQHELRLTLFKRCEELNADIAGISIALVQARQSIGVRAAVRASDDLSFRMQGAR